MNADLFRMLGDFSDLPEELFLVVLANVPPSDLWRTRAVCKRWNELTRDQFLWRAICERHLPSVIKPKEKSWEWLYMAKKVMLKVRAALVLLASSTHR